MRDPPPNPSDKDNHSQSTSSSLSTNPNEPIYVPRPLYSSTHCLAYPPPYVARSSTTINSFATGNHGPEPYHSSGYVNTRPIDPRLIRSPPVNSNDTLSSSNYTLDPNLVVPPSEAVISSSSSAEPLSHDRLLSSTVLPSSYSSHPTNAMYGSSSSSLSHEVYPSTYATNTIPAPSTTLVPHNSVSSSSDGNTIPSSSTTVPMINDSMIDDSHTLYDPESSLPYHTISYPHPSSQHLHSYPLPHSSYVSSSSSSDTYNPSTIAPRGTSTTTTTSNSMVPESMNTHAVPMHHTAGIYPSLSSSHPPPSDYEIPSLYVTRQKSSSSTSSWSSSSSSSMNYSLSPSSTAAPSRPGNATIPPQYTSSSSSSSTKPGGKFSSSSTSSSAPAYTAPSRPKGFTAKDLAKQKANSEAPSKSSMSVDTELRSEINANHYNNLSPPSYPFTTLIRSVSELNDRYPNLYVPEDCTHVVSNWVHTIPVPTDRLRKLVTPQGTSTGGNTSPGLSATSSTFAPSSSSVPRTINSGNEKNDNSSSASSSLFQNFYSLFSLDIERIHVPTVSDRWRKTVAYNDKTTAAGNTSQPSLVFSDPDGNGKSLPMRFNVRFTFFSTPYHAKEDYIASLASVRTSLSLEDYRIVLGRDDALSYMIGGSWNATEDGGNPLLEDNCLVRTAIRYGNNQAGIDLSVCNHWVKILTVNYRRNDVMINNVRYPDLMEINTYFLVLDAGKACKMYREVYDNSTELHNVNTNTVYHTVAKGRRTYWETDTTAGPVKFPPPFGSRVSTSILSHNASSIGAPLLFPCVRLVSTPSNAILNIGDTKNASSSRTNYGYYRIYTINELQTHFRKLNHFYDSEDLFEVALFVEALYELFMRDSVHILNIAIELYNSTVQKRRDDPNNKSKKLKRGSSTDSVTTSKIPFFSDDKYRIFFMNELYSAMNILNYGDYGNIQLKELFRLHQYAGLRMSESYFRNLMIDLLPREIHYRESATLNLKRIIRGIAWLMDQTE